MEECDESKGMDGMEVIEYVGEDVWPPRWQLLIADVFFQRMDAAAKWWAFSHPWGEKMKEETGRGRDLDQHRKQ